MDMKITTLLALGMAIVAGLSGCGGGGNGGGSSVAVYGVTNANQLIKFEENSPGDIDLQVAITGLQSGETILALDFRPLDGVLYGLGSTSRLYTLNTVTGVATQVGAGPFSPTLSGSAFGFDFNPVVDRIRIVSDTEQNFRLNPSTGALTATDTPLNPAGTVVAAAYTPAVANLTTLYAIDAASDSLVMIGGVGATPSPNGGVVTNIGGLGIDITTNAGFDIDSGGTAYLVSMVGGTPSLYTVDLVTGDATFQGMVGANVLAIAVTD